MDWVTVAVAFVGGTGFAKLVEVVGDRWRGATERRRAEVDRIAAQMSAAVARADAAVAERDNARRRERIATEHAHELRVLVLQAGVPSSQLPVLDFRDE